MHRGEVACVTPNVHQHVNLLLYVCRYTTHQQLHSPTLGMIGCLQLGIKMASWSYGKVCINDTERQWELANRIRIKLVCCFTWNCMYSKNKTLKTTRSYFVAHNFSKMPQISYCLCHLGNIQPRALVHHNCCIFEIIFLFHCTHFNIMCVLLH